MTLMRRFANIVEGRLGDSPTARLILRCRQRRSWSFAPGGEVGPACHGTPAAHHLGGRNQTLVATKQRQVLERTTCRAGAAGPFDVPACSNLLGQGRGACHHRVPIAPLQPATRTRLADLAIVCATCHRMRHRARPVLTLPALRAHLR